MQNKRIVNVILVVSGLIASGIGAAILFWPVAFHANASIELGQSASLMSEVRAPGAALLASGLLIVAGAFLARLRLTAAVMATALFLSYGVGRLVSMVADGRPDGVLVQALIWELVIGAVCAFVLWNYRDKALATS